MVFIFNAVREMQIFALKTFRCGHQMNEPEMESALNECRICVNVYIELVRPLFRTLTRTVARRNTSSHMRSHISIIHHILNTPTKTCSLETIFRTINKWKVYADVRDEYLKQDMRMSCHSRAAFVADISRPQYSLRVEPKI